MTLGQAGNTSRRFIPKRASGQISSRQGKKRDKLWRSEAIFPRLGGLCHWHLPSFVSLGYEDGAPQFSGPAWTG